MYKNPLTIPNQKAIMHNLLYRTYKILAIETSCDETSAAILHKTRLRLRPLANVVSSQISLHKKTFGVVPEVAARAHIQKIEPVVKKALRDAGLKLADIDYIAVTAGPGLVPSLLVGTEYAKALALAAGKKFIAENHMLGHLYSAFLRDPKMPLPSMNLIVSGSHTYLIYLEKKGKLKIIGQTVDDAAGEAFDKVAKMLGLAYPGGPEVSRWAEKGKFDYQFPRPMLHAKNFNFSFAGLKTAVLYKIKNDRLDTADPQVKADLCYSFENAAVDVLIKKTMRAAREYKVKTITLSGGVAANTKLRAELNLAAKKAHLKFYVPEFALCTDNALMIANAAAIRLENSAKKFSNIAKVRVDPHLALR